MLDYQNLHFRTSRDYLFVGFDSTCASRDSDQAGLRAQVQKVHFLMTCPTLFFVCLTSSLHLSIICPVYGLLFHLLFICLRWLKLSSLGEIVMRRHIEIFFFSYFSQKAGFDISCKLSPLETICMKCQNPFSWKNKKKYYQIAFCWISLERGKD